MQNLRRHIYVVKYRAIYVHHPDAAGEWRYFEFLTRKMANAYKKELMAVKPVEGSEWYYEAEVYEGTIDWEHGAFPDED